MTTTRFLSFAELRTGDTVQLRRISTGEVVSGEVTATAAGQVWLADELLRTVAGKTSADVRFLGAWREEH